MAIPDGAHRIYFMHIKKCAGTSIVGMARRQRDRIRLPENNANAIPAHPKETGLTGEERWIKFWDWPLQKQRKYIDDLGCNFIANEGCIDENFERMDDFFRLICMRNGVDRCISHYRHLLRLGKVSGVVQELVDNSGANQGLFNYATYQLTGRKVVGYDIDAIKIAIENLSLFDHIIFSESYESDRDFLIQRLGWIRPKELEKRNSSEDGDGVLLQLTPSIRAGLSQLNGSDQAILEWAIAQQKSS